jgi:deoxyribodipyrimidine photo-lyase
LVLQGKAKLVRHWGPSLYHIDDLPFSEGLATLPSVFTPFREKVEKQCKVRTAQGRCAVCACIKA